MSEDEICTFDTSFIDDSSFSSPLLTVSARDRIVTTSVSASNQTQTTHQRTKQAHWNTIPLQVPSAYAQRNDGNIHEWGFRIISCGKDDDDEIVLGFLPCSVWIPSESSPLDVLHYENIRRFFSSSSSSSSLTTEDRSGGNFYLTQPNCNMAKLLQRHFDVADLICNFPRIRTTLLAMITSVFAHSEATIESWHDFFDRHMPSARSEDDMVRFHNNDLVIDSDESAITVARLIGFEDELKFRLHETFDFDVKALVRFFFSAFDGDASFLSFMRKYLENVSNRFSNEENNNVNFRLRAQRYASKNHPQQLRNQAALESWAKTFEKLGSSDGGSDGNGGTGSGREQPQTHQNRTQHQQHLEHLLLTEPVFRKHHVALLLDNIFQRESPLEFGVGITRNGVLRGSAKILSLSGNRCNFTSGDTVILTLDHKSGRMSVRVGDRIVVADIEVPDSGGSEGSPFTLAPAVSFSSTSSKQSVEILYHHVIPRNAVHLIPWLAREGAISDWSRPASSYLNSVFVHPDSAFGENAGGDAPWRIPPLLAMELDVGNYVVSSSPRSKLPSSKIEREVKTSAVTGTNLFETLMDTTSIKNPFSFTSPICQRDQKQQQPLLHLAVAKKVVDMVTEACWKRSRNQQQQQLQQPASTVTSSPRSPPSSLLSSSSPARATSVSVSRPEEIDSSFKFFDTRFPPISRSINIQVATQDIDAVHGAPIITHNNISVNSDSSFSPSSSPSPSSSSSSSTSWSRISDFAKAEAQVDERSYLSPSKKLPLVEYPTLVAPSASPRDVVRANFDEVQNATVVSELASAALIPEFGSKIFYPSAYNPAGVYCVALFDPVTLQWFGVVIDDFLPVSVGRPRFVYSSRRNEYWPSLLLKALAKFYGSYQSLWDGNIPFFASPALLLRGASRGGAGSARRYTPSTKSDFAHALSFYADRAGGDKMHAVFACSGARDPITGHDQTVAEIDGTFTGSSYLVLRAVPIEGLMMVELLSSSATEVWIGAWSPDSTAWSQHPAVASACDVEYKGAPLPEGLQHLRRTCSFWVSLDEMSVYFKTLKCVAADGHHFDPFDSNALLINTGQTEHEHVETAFRDIPRGPSYFFHRQLRQGNHYHLSNPLVASIIQRHPFGRVPCLPDDDDKVNLTAACQRVQLQYLSRRESEMEEEIPFILGLTGGFFPATCPQYILKTTEANTTVTLLCDFVFHSNRGKIWRKADGVKSAPSPLVALFRFPDENNRNAKDATNIENRHFAVSARNKRILFPEHVFPQIVVKNTLNQSSSASSSYSFSFSSSSQTPVKPLLSWRSGAWSEPITLKEIGQYMIVVLLPRDGGASAVELSLLGSSAKIPAIEMVPAVPYRAVVGEMASSASPRQRQQKMTVQVTSSGTGDDRVVVEVDAEDFANLVPGCCKNKNLRLRMSVICCDGDGGGKQVVVVQGTEFYTTRLSAACALQSEKSLTVVVDFVCDAVDDDFPCVVDFEKKVQAVKAEVRVTSVLGKRHNLSLLRDEKEL